ANATLSDGVGTFGVTLDTAGSTSVTATDTGDSALTGSNDLAVDPAAAASFQVSTPDGVTAGTPFDITVTALDAFGNTATGYAGTVQVTSSDGTAVLPASATLNNGVGSFSVTLDTAGSAGVTAADAGDSTLTGGAN